MTAEEVNYIISYFSNLIDRREAIALSHHFYSAEVKSAPDNSSKRDWLIKKEKMTDDPEILKLLDAGYEQLRLSAAENVLKNHPGKVFFNCCKICGKLARTPRAKQCRFCGHDWLKTIRCPRF
ncbi:hypothetical protein ACFFGT_07250 [Mucilaginibacter angelicae]|uniref:Uncharacterized protein n=1 Tax=Mucilaginibacter angelicae TaxID=869718 RepID=A0ABV6L2N9_9SPHI